MGEFGVDMTDIVKLGRKGELTLPGRVRAVLNLNEGDELVVEVEGGAVVLRRKARRFGAYLERLASSGRAGE